MYRSRFSSVSQAGAAGGALHGNLSDLALGLPRKVVAPKEKVRSSKGESSKDNKRQRRMETSGVVDESVLFADFSRIREMAGDYREWAKHKPDRYVQLRPCATFDDVKNGGPPFQIDGDLYARWCQETATRCPVMVRCLMAFFQERVAYHKDQTSPSQRVKFSHTCAITQLHF